MIQFFKGTKSQYNSNYPSNSQLTDAIFFATDTGEILINGVNYGKDLDSVKDVNFDSATNTFTFTVLKNGAESTVTASLGDKLLTEEDRRTLDEAKEIFQSGGELSVTYVSKLDSDLAMLDPVGGIPAGTKVSDLSNVKSLSEMFDELLFPTVQPTVVAPKVTLALNGYANLQEVGATAPIASNFKTSFDQGQINLGGKVQNTRAGAKDHDILYYGGSEANTTLPEKVAAGGTTYSYVVYYQEGPQPLDSKGGNATDFTKLAAGKTNPASVTVTGVYPFYSGLAVKGVDKLSLTNSTEFNTTISAEGNEAGKHVIKLPHTITSIIARDPNFGDSPNIISNFTKTTENIDVNGNQVQYNVYTRSDAGFNGETLYVIKYSK